MTALSICAWPSRKGWRPSAPRPSDYPAVTELTIGTVTAELRGEAAERYTLAVWTDGQYAYSLRLSDGQSTEVWQRLLAGVRTEG